MNIDFLKTFIHVIEQSSISKAAEDMNISQSALSQRIKSLEDQWNGKLLERSYKGVFPTNLGEIVYHHGKNISSSYEQMLMEITQEKSADQNIHILSTPTLYSHVLPCALYEIKTSYPLYTLKVETLPSKVLEDRITQGFADIGFIAERPQNKSLVTKKIFSDKVFLVASPHIDIPKELTATQLYDHPFLMLPNAQKTRQILDFHLKKLGVDTEKLQILYTLDSVESIKLSTINGYGLTFLPYTVIKKELHKKQLQIVELSDFNLEIDYYSIKSPKPRNLGISEAIEYIEKNIIDIIC